jgi:hypothetical protein
MSHRFRHLQAALVVAILASGGVAAYAADQDKPGIKLFKVITAKDEIVIGWKEADLRALGPRPDLENLAQHLANAGQFTAWQYAVRKGADGALHQAPQKRVAVFKNDTLRIEPFNPAPLAVEPLPAD